MREASWAEEWHELLGKHCCKAERAPGVGAQVKSRFTLLGGKKAMCRGGGSRAQGLWCARVWSPPPPGLSKEPGER